MGECIAPSSTDPIPAIRFMSIVGLGMLAMAVFKSYQTLDWVCVTAVSPWTSHRIDPASASAAEWTLVPGIGPAMSRRLEWHRARGGFESSTVANADGVFRPWDLQAVSGIGPIAARRAAPYLLHPALSKYSGVSWGTRDP